ncbi:outer membrane lipoprotein carrier protein LolA [Myxococcota bacterium]|nr:outer membrane lipoprotein carrier protein LolA [Myxococcota bacterium]
MKFRVRRDRVSVLAGPHVGLIRGLLWSCSFGAAILLQPDVASGEGSGPDVKASVSSCEQAAIAAVQSRYQSLRDLRVRFTQTRRATSFGQAMEPVPAKGVAEFAKPGRMRWAYESPEPSLLVSDGTTIWLYDPAHAEAQRFTTTGDYFGVAGVHFLIGEGELVADFDVRSHRCDDSEAMLELVPKVPSSYEKLWIRVDPSTGDLLESRIGDLLGNVTAVQFSEIEVNLDPDPLRFQFDPPDGVRVIDVDAQGAGTP